MRGKIILIFVFLVVFCFSVSAQSYNSMFKFTQIVYPEEYRRESTSLAHFIFNTIRIDAYNDTSTGYHVLGDVFLFEKKLDPLDGAEPLNGIVDVITAEDLKSLNNGKVRMKKIFNYTQKIYFYPNGYTSYGYADDIPDDQDNIPRVYLKFQKDVPAYRFEVDFEKDLRIKPDIDGRLNDLEDVMISLLGKNFTFEKAFYHGAGDIEFSLFTGEVQDVLQETETKKYVVDNKEYEIEAISISDKIGEVLFRINDEKVRALKINSADITENYQEIYVKNILSNEAGEIAVGDLVEFIFSPREYIFHDSDMNSNIDINYLEANREIVDDVFIQVEATELPDGYILIDKFYLTWIPEHDYYIQENVKASDIVEDKNSLFAGIDFLYNGFYSNIDTESIDLVPEGKDEYHLKIETDNKNTMDIPLFYDDQGAGNPGDDFERFGDDKHSLIVQETLQINKDDYFIVTPDGSEWNYAKKKSHLLRYKSQDVNLKLLTFYDEKNNRIDIQYDPVTLTTYIPIDGFAYYVEIVQDVNNDGPIVVDLNNNGVIDFFMDDVTFVTRLGTKIQFDTTTYDSITITSNEMREGAGPLFAAALRATGPPFNLYQQSRSYDSVRISVVNSPDGIEIDKLERCSGADKKGLYNYLTPLVGFPANYFLTLFVIDNCFASDPVQFMYEVNETEDQEGTTIFGFAVEKRYKENGADEVSIVAPKEALRNLVYLTTTGFKLNNKTYVIDKIPEGALLRDVSNIDGNAILIGGSCKNKKTKSLFGETIDCNEDFKGKGLIMHKTIDNKDYLLITGYSSYELQKTIDYFINNKVDKDIVIDIAAGELAKPLKDYLALEEDVAEKEKSAKPTIKCEGSNYEAKYITTKGSKFGISKITKNLIEVKMDGLEGYIKFTSDSPFKATFGIDFLDITMHILKGNCNGEEVTVVKFHQVDGMSSDIKYFTVPEEGCYCVRTENKDLYLDNAKILISDPSSPVDIKVRTN